MTSSTSTPEQIPTNYTGTGGSSATLIGNVITTTNGGIEDTFNATNSSSQPKQGTTCSNITDCVACVGSTDKNNTSCHYDKYYDDYTKLNSYRCESTGGDESAPPEDKITNPANCPASTDTTATEFTSDTTKNTARLTNKSVGEPIHIQDPTNSENIQTTTTIEYTITVTGTGNVNQIYTATIDVVTSDPDANTSIYVIPRDGSVSAADYSHGSGTNIPTTYYANGKTLRVVYDNGVYYIIVIDPVSGTIRYTSTAATDQASLTKYTFTGTNGGSAVVFKSKSGNNYLAKVTYPDGQFVIYTTTGPTVSSDSEMYNNNTNTYTATTGSSGTAYSGPNATVYTTDTPYTSTSGSSAYNNGYDYSSSEPQGVSRSNIPEGDEDLYMLKSQIVPPVCPACPGCNKTVNINSSSNGDKCQPCPACARCPKPAFDCKKVPNYKTIDDSFLPSPVMNTAYTTYGM
jgi:hypothetical protein